MEHQIILGSFDYAGLVVLLSFIMAGLLAHIGGDDKLSYLVSGIAAIGGGWAGYIGADWYWLALSQGDPRLLGGTWLAWGAGAAIGAVVMWLIARHISKTQYWPEPEEEATVATTTEEAAPAAAEQPATQQ